VTTAFADGSEHKPAVGSDDSPSSAAGVSTARGGVSLLL
jgi:hypothetical protein